MSTFKWDLLKEKALAAFNDKLNGCHPFPTDALFLALAGSFGAPKEKPSAVLEEWKAFGCSLIRQWDIRKAAKLFELFPEIIQKKLRGRAPVAELDERGTWIISFPS